MPTPAAPPTMTVPITAAMRTLTQNGTVVVVGVVVLNGFHSIRENIKENAHGAAAATGTSPTDCRLTLTF